MAIMCRKYLSFSIKEIPCPESNRIIGAELSDKKGGRWYIFGVYLSDNNLDIYAREITIVENMYHYYSSYGKVILGGDFDGSLATGSATYQPTQIQVSDKVCYELWLIQTRLWF